MSQSSAGVTPIHSDLVERLLALVEREAAAQPVEHRADVRHPLNAPVSLGIVSANDLAQMPDHARFKVLHRGWATDVSSAGIGLLIEHELPTGMTVWVGLEALLNQPALAPIRVVYCNRLLPHTYRVGGVFVPVER